MNSLKKLELYCEKNKIAFPEFKVECYEDKPIWYSASCEFKGVKYETKCYTPTALRQSLCNKILQSLDVVPKEKTAAKPSTTKTQNIIAPNTPKRVSHIRIRNFLNIFPNENQYSVYALQIDHSKEGYDFIPFMLGIVCNVKTDLNYSFPLYHRGYMGCRWFYYIIFIIVMFIVFSLIYIFFVTYSTDLKDSEIDEIKWISCKILSYKYAKNKLRLYPNNNENYENKMEEENEIINIDNDDDEDEIEVIEETKNDNNKKENENNNNLNKEREEGINYIYPNINQLTDNIKNYKNYYIVPIDKETLRIDFNYIKNIKEKMNKYNDRCLYDVMKEEINLNINNFIVSRTYTSEFNRFRILNIRNDLNPLSAYPADSNYSSYSDFCVNKYKATITDMSQPLIEATYCPNIKSKVKILTTSPPPGYVDNDKKPKTSTFVPELLKIVDPTSDLMNVCFKIPTLLTIFEWSMRFKWFTGLLENNLNTNFSGKCINELEIAITPAEFNPVDNYELYETLGDTLLEIFSTVVLFFKKTNINEGQLTYDRKYYTSNSMFNNLCKKWCFDEYISLIFSFFFIILYNSIIKQSLIPQKLILPGFIGEENYDIGKKTLADIFESIVFVIYKYNNMEKAIEFFTNIMFPNFKYSKSILISWIVTNVKDEEIIQKYNLLKSNISDNIITYKLPNNLEYLEYIIEYTIIACIVIYCFYSYQFHDKRLLVKSFTSKSILPREKIIEESYERLEFLGDAILDWILLDYTYNLFDNKLNPGLLYCMKNLH